MRLIFIIYEVTTQLKTWSTYFLDFIITYKKRLKILVIEIRKNQIIEK